MRLPFCVACAATDDLQHHHLVTRAEGGDNEETNLITLCTACHYKAPGYRSEAFGGIDRRPGAILSFCDRRSGLQVFETAEVLGESGGITIGRR
jgi:hypothetical protein